MPPSLLDDPRSAWRRRNRRARRQRVLDYPLQALGVALFYWLFRALPIDAASAWGGRILRTIGPWLGASRTARRNVAETFPDMPKPEIDRIVRGMWDNLGRVLAEYTHLDRLLGDPEGRIEIVGLEHVRDRARRGEGCVMAIAHLGNWEVSAVAAAMEGLPIWSFYRPLNNPHVDRWLLKLREKLGNRMLAKRMEGGASRRALGIVRGGGVLGLLVDQHFSGGIDVPFLGRPSLTSPAAVEFARHLGCALLPIRVERLEGARFRVTIAPPLEIPAGLDRKEAVREGARRMNEIIGDWILERPEQWLWLHKRWKG